MLNDDENLLFDQEGSDGLLAEMIAGGNYFVKADQRYGLVNTDLFRYCSRRFGFLKTMVLRNGVLCFNSNGIMQVSMR